MARDALHSLADALGIEARWTDADGRARRVAPEALEALATAPELRAEMGAANLKRVRQFGWDHLVAQVRQQYVAALASRGRTVDGAVDPTAAAV